MTAIEKSLRENEQQNENENIIIHFETQVKIEAKQHEKHIALVCIGV